MGATGYRKTIKDISEKTPSTKGKNFTNHMLRGGIPEQANRSGATENTKKMIGPWKSQAFRSYISKTTTEVNIMNSLI